MPWNLGSRLCLWETAPQAYFKAGPQSRLQASRGLSCPVENAGTVSVCLKPQQLTSKASEQSLHTSRQGRPVPYTRTFPAPGSQRTLSSRYSECKPVASFHGRIDSWQPTKARKSQRKRGYGDFCPCLCPIPFPSLYKFHPPLRLFLCHILQCGVTAS